MGFRSAIEDLRAHGRDARVMMKVIEHASSASDSEIAALARTLADSGRVAPQRDGTSDVASTGGPSSLSTLISPLFLRALGCTVPKVGVPGRPAGAIDVMSTIPGYKVSLSQVKFEEVLSSTGFCHVLADDDLAPLDGVLFKLRRDVGAVNIAPLVIASLLSKKIAVGLEHAVIDVRVWRHGNFGKDHDEARTRAERFCRVSKLVGIKATCVLTDLSSPQQPYIGRGESLLALESFLWGKPEPWLNEHLRLCFFLAAQAFSKAVSYPATEWVREIFAENLRKQGSSLEQFLRYTAAIKKHQTKTIIAESEGFVVPDLLLLRRIIVEQQKVAIRQTDSYPDPLGVQLLVKPRTPVKPGTPIATIRWTNDAARAASSKVKQALPIVSGCPKPVAVPEPVGSSKPGEPNLDFGGSLE